MYQHPQADPWRTSLDAATVAAIGAAVGASTAGPDRELAIHAFRVAIAFSGASVGDLILAVRVINTSTGSPVAEGSTLWLNETAQTTLGSAPDLANLQQAQFTGLTSAQLAAMTLLVNPTADGETVTALTDGAGVRQAVGSSTAAFNLPTMGVSRRVRIRCSVATYLRFGTSSGVTASVAGTSIPFEANAPEYVVVPAGMTHFAVIREGSVDGNIHIQPTVD